jgi:hypothetical protein
LISALVENRPRTMTATARGGALSQFGGKARMTKLTTAQRTTLTRKEGKMSGAARRKRAKGRAW